MLGRKCFPDTVDRIVRSVAQWYLGKCATDPLFLAKVLFSDMPSFKREGNFNSHDDHMWAEENSHTMRRCVAQTGFSVNAWASFMSNHLIGPHLLSFPLTGRNYLLFLQRVLPQLLGDEQISASMQQTIWFQHDGSAAYYIRNIRNCLDVTFGQQWIGRGGPVH